MMKSSRRSTRAVAAQERGGNLAALNIGAFPATASHRRAESVRAVETARRPWKSRGLLKYRPRPFRKSEKGLSFVSEKK